MKFYMTTLFTLLHLSMVAGENAPDAGEMANMNTVVDSTSSKIDHTIIPEEKSSGLRGGVKSRYLAGGYVDLANHSPDQRGQLDVWITNETGDWSSIPTSSKPHSIGNDAITYVRTTAGRMVELWEHSNFRGKVLLVGDFFNVQEITNLNSKDFNDITSSFRIRDIPSTNKVKLCQHLECNDNSSSTRALLSVGSHATMPSQIGNDKLTSIYVPKGFKVKVWEHSNFGGGSREFSNPSTTSAVHFNLVNFGINDKVSSILVTVI